MPTTAPVSTYSTTGTTSAVFVPRETTAKVIGPGDGYFFIQIKSAQAAFTGHFWERVRSLIVTSQVAINHPALGAEPVQAIRRSIEVVRNRAEQLGMSPNLVRLVPAAMSSVSVSVEFVLDKENRLAALSGLINSDAFLTAVSLAPAAAATARTIGALSQKLMESFMKAEERQPILQFAGDLNIAGGLKEGYYVILGTRDDNNPLPRPMPVLEIRNDALLADGKEITQLSYVVLDVRCVSARTRSLNDGAAWDERLRQAEAAASHVSNNPAASADERKEAWQACLKSLQEAQILLRADPSYLQAEAASIIKSAYADCYAQVFGTHATRASVGTGRVTERAQGDLPADRLLLSINPEENLGESLDAYAEEVAESRRVLRQFSNLS